MNPGWTENWWNYEKKCFSWERLQERNNNTRSSGRNRSFTRKIKGVDGLDYAHRLKKLKRSSIQRQERFKIIYLYKIQEGLVPNISETKGLTFKKHIDMDTDVLSHTSLSEEKLGELETAHTPGPHVICGILSQSVSIILLGKRLIS